MFSLILTMLLTAATPGCTFDGPEVFNEGGNLWCETGAFDKVTLTTDDTYTFVKLELNLNADGFEAYSKNPEKFSMLFAGIIEEYGSVGVPAIVTIHFGGQTLVSCWGDFEKRETVCLEGERD